MLEARVLGVLVEKAHTVPDSYPLSLNSLTLCGLVLAGGVLRSAATLGMPLASYIATYARYALVEHAWHAPFLPHADVVARHMLDFLAGVKGENA